MITTRKELRDYIAIDMSQDKEIAGKKMFIEWLKGNLRAHRKYKFLKLLRYMEYCENNRNNYFSKIRYLWIKHRFQKYQLKTQMFIHPNVCGKGLKIAHPCFMWIDNQAKIGQNCTILPHVLIGNNGDESKIDMSKPTIIVRDNSYLGVGCKILGPVKIGNNVTIAANAVVIRDVPDNCIVAGVPAVIKKYKRDEKNT